MPRIITITMNPSLDLSTSVDRFVAGRKLRCGPARVDPGGGGINVSRVIRELCGESVCLATIGGHSGKALADLLREGGVTPRRIPIAGAMRRNLAIAERETGRQFRFVLPGPLVRGSEWRRALARIQGLLGPGDLLVASGSLAPGVPADFCARLARSARRRGAHFLIDSSGPALKAALAAGADLVKPNRHEFKELSGQGKDDWQNIAVVSARWVA